MTGAQMDTRGGFVVIKLIVDGRPQFLVRKNPKWKDLNLIGGHEKARDQCSLQRTALRELWEEVPSVRKLKDIHLVPLTNPRTYGPVFSRSAAREKQYELQFFLLRIDSDPAPLLEGLSRRTKNILVPQDRLVKSATYRVSGLIQFLDDLLPNGIASIPLSSSVPVRCPDAWRHDQLEMEFLSAS
jgi:8-oxo-dGTP pyrophosphatase MutT (NUDIX family)